MFKLLFISTISVSGSFKFLYIKTKLKRAECKMHFGSSAFSPLSTAIRRSPFYFRRIGAIFADQSVSLVSRVPGCGVAARRFSRWKEGRYDFEFLAVKRAIVIVIVVRGCWYTYIKTLCVVHQPRGGGGEGQSFLLKFRLP